MQIARILGRLICVLSIAFAAVSAAQSASISYTATNLGGSSWRYNYTINNGPLDPALEEFTIYFDLNLYASLAPFGTVDDWDVLVVQPDPAIPDDGFYDGLALVTGISPGGAQGGFAVDFDYFGLGNPGAQPYDIVDPVTFAALSSGMTTLLAVPPPGN